MAIVQEAVLYGCGRRPVCRLCTPQGVDNEVSTLQLLFLVVGLLTVQIGFAARITVAAAADLKYAMDEVVAAFRHLYPADAVQVTYGSSGKFYAQIRNGAPYDLFFSADIHYPRELARAGLAASEVIPYAVGRIVLWSATLDADKLTLASLANPAIMRVAIANPRHAPYGIRAEEALRASGLWETVRPKLVYGENIAQTAQFVQSGGAQVGVIALSLALSPQMTRQGGYSLIPEHLHSPLEQGFILTRRGEGNALARRFADYVQSPPARAVMRKYGFRLPGQ